MLPIPLGDEDVLRTLGLYVRSCGVTRKGDVDLEAGVDFNERVERVDGFIDTEDPVKQRQFYLGFRAKFNTLCEKHRLPMWPTVPSFYGYDDKCVYDLWYFYKALLVLVTPPVVDIFKEALEYERRLVSSERHIVTAEDAINYEIQRQLSKLKPPPRPVGLEAVIQRRMEHQQIKEGVQVPADRVFKYIP
jgi:hypothetical protein